MSDKFLNSEESGVPVPPVEQGWSAMQHMLDKAMPVHTPSSPTAPKPTPKPGASAVIKGLLKGALISGTAVTVSVSSWWLYKHAQQAKVAPPALVQQAVDTPAADAVQFLRDSSYGAIPPSGLDSSHMMNDFPETDPAQTGKQQTASANKEQATVADISEEQSHTATGTGKRTPVTKGDQTAAAVRSSDGIVKTNHTTDAKAASRPPAQDKPSTTLQQAGTHIKKQATGHTGHASGPTTQVPANTGSKKTPAGLSSSQQSASTGPVLPSTGQQTPRAGSPQLPGVGKPPAASGANHDTRARTFAGNYPRKKAAKPLVTGTGNNAGTKDISTPKDHLLPADRNRTTSDEVLPATADKWILEPVTQPDQGRNVSLLHNGKDRHTIPTAAVPRHKREIHSAWNIYGQLPVAIPLTGSTYYFTGPDGKKQYWRLLIPSLRIERAIGHVALSADVMPFINMTLPSNEYHSRKAGSAFPQYDTIRSVIKQHGTGFTLQAHYFLTSHLKISAGAQLSLLGKATVSQTLADTSNKRNPTVFRAATTTETDSLVRSRISGLFEVYYEFGKWQTGVRTIVPFTNTGLQKNWPVSTPVQVELLFRRRLFTR